MVFFLFTLLPSLGAWSRWMPRRWDWLLTCLSLLWCMVVHSSSSSTFTPHASQRTHLCFKVCSYLFPFLTFWFGWFRWQNPQLLYSVLYSASPQKNEWPTFLGSPGPRKLIFPVPNLLLPPRSHLDVTFVHCAHLREMQISEMPQKEGKAMDFRGKIWNYLKSLAFSSSLIWGICLGLFITLLLNL